MERAWIIAGIVVPGLGTIGGALMALTPASAHYAACIAFLVAGGWLAVTGFLWGGSVQIWNWRTQLYAAAISLGVMIAPVMIWFAWPAEAQAPLPSVNGNCNAIGNNNSACNTYNLGHTRLRFSRSLGAELLAKLPKGNPITIETVGSPSDWNVGVEIANFLFANGYNIARFDRIGVLSPPPDHPLEWNQKTSTLIVAPSVQ